jgi:hypothetical protein
MIKMHKSFKEILFSKISYLELFTRLFVFSVLFIFLSCLNIFLYVGQFGAGASSGPENHPVTAVIYGIYPLIGVFATCIFLMVKNYKVQQYEYVKIYIIVIIMTIVLYLFLGNILSDLF